MKAMLKIITLVAALASRVVCIRAAIAGRRDEKEDGLLWQGLRRGCEVEKAKPQSESAAPSSAARV